MKPLQFVSYRQLDEDIIALAQQLDGVQGVVGVPRSGAMAALRLATLTGLPVCDLNAFLLDEPFIGPTNRPVDVSGSVLVLDDSSGSGRTLARVAARVRAHGRAPAIFGAIYLNPKSRFDCDVIVRVVPSPRIFEWNLWRHYLLGKALLDFDGVLCPDPPRDDDQAGGPYQEFIEKAPRRYLPQVPVAGIVTNRLERWRRVSQAWLDHYGVVAGRMWMAPYESAAERRRKHGYGAWKGEIFAASDARIFVESSIEQAKVIAGVAKKPVICTDEMVVVQGERR